MSNVVSLGMRTCIVCDGVPTRTMSCSECGVWLQDWADAVLSGDETLREMITALTEVADGFYTAEQQAEYHAACAEHDGRDPYWVGA